MLCLPPRFAAIILAFASVFVQQRTWRHARLLLLGALLAPGQRTVSSILRIIGLRRERHFVNYHRVLNRAIWRSRHAARLLLDLLINRFVSTDPIVLGVDDTIERRRGKRISAKGIYRDPVRSSKSFFVKTSGLRWLSLMVLAPVPWAQRVWGLPFLTVLAPSERFCRTHNQRHKKLTDWTRQVALQARRWLPKRLVVLVGDSSFAALDLLAALMRQGLICITRLRLDAALYKPAAPREPGAKGRPRKKGARLPTLIQRLQDPSTEWQSISVSGWYGNTERRLQICSDRAVWYHAGLPVLPIRWVLLRDPNGAFAPQALLCTDPAHDAHDIIGWFVRRWALEVTFRETRDHLGIETQRQWSDQAIARTTPCLLALFSIVTLLGTRLTHRARLAVSTAAWYHKQRPTFADTLAAVRREIWAAQGFSMSRSRVDSKKPSKALREGMTYALCNAA
ncbi:IS701 family transposase [Rhodopila sp.]|uniref:IS701 family transposase n=1 Tax=Rhodopila sp. TaxID=2480087 RepID=UPI003D122002